MIPSQLPELSCGQDVVNADLSYICDGLKSEFTAMSGKHVLITGGAGFLGYYLVQAALHWNAQCSSHKPIRITIYENFIRGVPTWLTAILSNPQLTITKHDITHPLR